MKDSHGRDIDYLRVSVTDRCNLRCIYCMPEQGIKKKQHKDILRYEDIIKVVGAAATLGIRKVRYTGGEPLILPDIDKLIFETSKLKGIEDIAITTNGILLSGMAYSLKRAGLKRVNISLDTLDVERFKKISRGGELSSVLESIEKAIAHGLRPVKINTVLMKGINDGEIKDFINLAKELPVEIRFIELMPIGEGVELYEKRKISFEEVLSNFQKLVPEHSESGSTAQLYAAKGAKGKIGFIRPMTCKFCSGCNKIRLTASGTIKPCLHSFEEINIREYLRSDVLLTAALRRAIYGKPLEHYLKEEKSSRSEKMMYQIGG